MGEIVIRGYLCERCKHTWAPRTYNAKQKPFVCPSCKSPYWNTPKKKVKKKGGKS